MKSGFKEEMFVHVDASFNVIGLSYSSPVIALPRPCEPNKVALTLLHVLILLIVCYGALTIALREPANFYPIYILQLKDPTLFHTRLRITEALPAQVVPLQATGQRPNYMNNVKEIVDGVEQPAGGQPQQSFLQKYVRFILFILISDEFLFTPL